MIPNWKSLLPHRPLDPGSELYVTPPERGGDRIAEWILAERTTVLVAGPVGIGKSTELARATALLRSERLPLLVRLDRSENMKRAPVDQLLVRMAGLLVTQAVETAGVSVSWTLRDALVQAGVLEPTFLERLAKSLLAKGVVGEAAASVPNFTASPLALLRLALTEVARGTSLRPVVLIDGLEKLPPGDRISELFEALGTVPEDEVDLVVVLPWSLAFGAGIEGVLRAGEHLVTLRAAEVEGEEGAPGRRFLGELLARRLGDSGHPAEIPAEPREAIERAACYSGGLVRIFLQLVADAGTYGRMRSRATWPSGNDLADAVADQEDSFRKSLRRGDNAAIVACVGSDGRELDLERKIRLLSHGVLLERVRGGEPVMSVHPLVAPLLHPEETSRA